MHEKFLRHFHLDLCVDINIVVVVVVVIAVTVKKTNEKETGPRAALLRMSRRKFIEMNTRKSVSEECDNAFPRETILQLQIMLRGTRQRGRMLAEKK